MADENTLLRVSGLSAAVDEKTILHDIDFAVGAGETHVLMARTAPASRRWGTWSWAIRNTR